jgi:hypothetical protein
VELIAMVTDDPIGRMFKRGQLRRQTARGGKTADDRLKAARMWQSLAIIGPNWIDARDFATSGPSPNSNRGASCNLNVIAAYYLLLTFPGFDRVHHRRHEDPD